MNIINCDINKDNIGQFDWDIIEVVNGDIYLRGYEHDFDAPNLTTSGDIVFS